MSNTIQITSSNEEKQAIYEFRYKVYMEELNKQHIAADHNAKMLFDEADANHLLYYALEQDEVIATVRLQSGALGEFSNHDCDYFDIAEFATFIKYKEIAIVDKLMVAKDYRHGQLAGKIMLTTYLQGLKIGTRVCFITCDEKLLPMYLKYGFRIYTDSALLPSGEKRYKLILFLCDKIHLQNVRSPFTSFLPEGFNDEGSYARLIEEKLGYTLIKELPTAA